MPNVSFKGTREGLCISFGEGPWRDLIKDVRLQLERPGAPIFFKGARVTLDPGSRRLGVLELEELMELLAKHNMILSSVNGPAPEELSPIPAMSTLPTVAAAPASLPSPAPSAPSTGFPAGVASADPLSSSSSSAARLSDAITSPTVSASAAPAPEPAKLRPAPVWPPVSLPPPETMPPPESIAPLSEPSSLTDAILARDPGALFIRRTVRSGQYVRHRGSIVVLGDVNPGAELIAEGDIIVWGKLRGIVHAGADGDENAMIGALVFMPTQLRIADKVARAPDYRRPRITPAEIAHIRNSQIIVEPWGA